MVGTVAKFSITYNTVPLTYRMDAVLLLGLCESRREAVSRTTNKTMRRLKILIIFVNIQYATVLSPIVALHQSKKLEFVAQVGH